MTTSRPSSPDTSRKLVALIFGANLFGALIIFLYFSMIDPLPVGGVAVRSLETEDILTFVIAGVVIFAGAFVMIGRPGATYRLSHAYSICVSKLFELLCSLKSNCEVY
jgi:adenylate cyclase